MENLFKIKQENIAKESLNINYKLFFKNKYVIFFLILSLICNLANWIILAIFSNKIDGDIILHYNVYFGVDNTGHWKQAFIMPIIGAGLLILNTLLANFFYINKERIASYILLLTAFMVNIGLIIASISIILINY